MAQIFATATTDINNVAAYPATAQFVFTTVPIQSFYIENRHATLICFFSFDGTTDAGFLNPVTSAQGFNITLDQPIRQIWVRQSAATVAATVIAVTGFGVT